MHNYIDVNFFILKHALIKLSACFFLQEERKLSAWLIIDSKIELNYEEKFMSNFEFLKLISIILIYSASSFKQNLRIGITTL